jgi:hypothetical protein
MVLALLAGGCAKRYYHPNKPQSAWVQDHKDCETMARGAARQHEEATNTVDEMKLIRKFMKKKGWEYR